MQILYMLGAYYYVVIWMRKIIIDLGIEDLDGATKRALTTLQNKGIIKDWYRVNGKLHIDVEAVRISEIIEKQDEFVPEIINREIKDL